MASKNYKARKRYSAAEKKAYWIGYGAGANSKSWLDFDPSLHDKRQGRGQRDDLCRSAQAGFDAGLKNRNSVHFAKGFKKYPVSHKDWIEKG